MAHLLNGSFTRQLIYSTAHSLNGLFIQRPIHSMAHSLNGLFTQRPIHLMAHSLDGLFTRPPIHSTVHSLDGPFTRRLIYAIGPAHSLDNLSSKQAQLMYSTKKSREWEWGPFAQWTIAIWVGRFTHLSKWGNAACRWGHSTNKTLPHQFLNFHLSPLYFRFPQHNNFNSHIINSFIRCDIVTFCT